MSFISKPVRQRERNCERPDQPSRSGGTDPWVLNFAIFFAMVALIWMCIGFVQPVLMAGLFAATLYPFHLRLEKKIASNVVRAGLLTTGFAIVFLLPVAAVSFLAASAGVRKFKDLPENWTDKLDVDALMKPLLDRVEGYLPMERAEIVRHVQQAATTLGKGALEMLQGLIADLPKLMVVNVVILIGIFVFLSQAPQILRWLRRFSPLDESKTHRLFKRVGGLSSSSVLATIISGFVQATLIGIVLLIMQVPGALLITMSAFVFSFVPIIGTAPVALYLIGSAAVVGNWSHVVIFVITAVVVSVSDNIVRPFVLSDAGKLNGFVAFVAAVGALETMGFYGLFLGPVVAGAVFTLVELVHEERKA
ncbi:AI-2E family transporter [soil metagenome]